MHDCSVISAFSSLVRLDIVNDLFNILDSLGPDQVLISILRLLIEQLCRLEFGLKLLGILGCAQSNGELLDLGLTLGEILNEPDESFLGVGHGL